MKKMAARDYENILQVRHGFDLSRENMLTRFQCAIPVFDGLFPDPHNRIVLNLLFACAHWHSLAKLRLHTDQTLQELQTSTVALATKFKDFKRTCASYTTYELPKEREKHQRAKAKKPAKVSKRANSPKPTESARSSAKSDQVTEEADDSTNARKEATFNLSTYKYHALGDYVATIKKYGTTDSYSTELVSSREQIILFI
jgi:hypothetical protein